MNIDLIIDITFAFGTSIFLISVIPQLLKVRRVTYSDSHSLIHNEFQIIAITCMVIGYVLCASLIALIVAVIQLIARIYLILLIRKKRSHELTYKSDIIYYTIKYIKKKIGMQLSDMNE